MPAHPARLLRHLRPPAPDADADLLGRFIRDRDEAAFAALVRRHGPMVLRVCRRVLADPDLADDAFQATFLVLARRAGSIRSRQSLAAWLHGVAYRVARSARAAGNRREATLPNLDPLDPRPDPLAEVSARELLAVVDEEVRRLPEAYRLPVILCCLEGHSREEAAALLGWTAGAVKGRLERGRARLHARLVRRGLTLGAALAAVTAVRAAPAALPAEETVRAALAFTAGRGVHGAAVAPRAGRLARRALRPTPVAGLRAVAALAVLGVGLAAAGALVHQGPAAATPAEDRPPSGPGDGQPPRADLLGDPLPDGALARLGTIRFRHGNGAAIAFAPDGKSVLSCGGDRTIRTWDLATGRLLREQRLPPGPTAHGPVLSPDGRLLAFQDASASDAFYLWDVEQGRLRHRLSLGEKWWHRAAFSPDGKTLVTAQNSGVLRAWDVATGQGRLLGRHGREVYSLAFTADGTLMSLSADQTVRFWDLAAGRERSRLNLAEFTPGGTVSPDGRTVAVWSFHNPEADHGLQFLDATTGRPVAGWLAPEVKQVHAARFTPDGKAVLVGTRDGILVWDPRAGRLLRTLPGGRGHGLTFAPDGKTVAALEGGDPNYPSGTVLHVWDLATGEPRAATVAESGHLGEVEAVAFAPDGRTVATSCRADGSVRLWETATGRPLRSLAAEDLTYHTLMFSPAGKDLFVGTSPAIVRREVATGREVCRYPLAEPGEGRRYHLALLQVSDDGRTLRAVSQVLDGRGNRHALHAWDVATGKRGHTRPLSGEDMWLGYGRFSPDGRLLALPGGILRDADTGQEVLRLPVEGKRTVDQPFAFSPDGGLVAGGIWQEIHRPDVHGQEVVAVQVWEVATGLPVVRLQTGELAHVAFPPGGRQLITVGPGALRRWDLASGREVARRAAPGGFRGSFGASFASCLAVAADGRTLATGHPDTTVLLWDLPAPGRPAGRLSAEELAACWADLAGEDAGSALAALARLAESPDQAAALLRDRLRSARAPAGDELRRLIADLDAPEFDRREAATKRLAALGELAEAGLREALRGRPSPEVRRRVEGLLADRRPARTPEARRGLRGVRLLESVGTPEARRLLENLGTGAPEAVLTGEAKRALERLARPSAAAP